MHRILLIGTLAFTAFAFMSGCSMRDVTDFAMNTAVHPNTSDLVRDVERTAEEVSAEEQAERVEELSAEYEEFLRESSGASDDEGDEERSIIMIDQEERY